VTSDLTPAGVSQRGVSGRVALGALVVALGALVVAGLLGKGSEPLARGTSERPQLAATPLASFPWIKATRAPAEPSPVTACVTPTIAPLTAPMPTHPRPVTPTGVTTVGAISDAIGSLVPDRDGGLWAASAGRLLRFDASGREVGSWSYDDSPYLAGPGLARAGAGGVWLIGARTLARFDGRGFRDVVTAPGDLAGMAEGADGSLWATIWRQGLYHWDGRLWTRVCGSPDDADVSQVAVDPGGSVWVSFTSGGGGGTAPLPARFDGTGWQTYVGAVPSDAWVVAGADGSIWAVGNENVAWFDGATWAAVDRAGVDLTGLWSIAPGRDGTFWAVVGGPGSGAASSPDWSVVRYARGTWEVFGRADGLPAGTEAGQTASAIVVAGDTPFVSLADGLYRLDGERWVRTWAVPQAAAGPSWLARIVGVSGDEAWAVGYSPGGAGLWHLAGDRWTRSRVADWSDSWSGGWNLPAIAYGGGVLAVAGDPGLAVLADGRWLTLARGVFSAVAVAADGRSVFALGIPSDGPVAGLDALTFSSSGGRWARTDLATEMDTATSLAVDRAGTWWFTDECYSGPCHLGSITDGRSTEIALPDAAGWDGYASVAAAVNGDVWVLFQPVSSDPYTPSVPLVERYRDGVWRSYGTPEGLAAQWAGHVVVAPDGSVLAVADGIWRLDGDTWSLVRSLGIVDLAFAPDGTAWAVEPSGLTRLPPEVIAQPVLSDAAAAWCADPAHWWGVHESAIALGIDDAAIDTRASTVLAARGRVDDPVARAELRRHDGDYIRACTGAFASR
jgi:hypothetical protein